MASSAEKIRGADVVQCLRGTGNLSIGVSKVIQKSVSPLAVIS